MAKQAAKRPAKVEAAEFLDNMEELQTQKFEDTFAEGLMLNEPSQLPGEDDVTWIKAQGWTPLEMLVHTYRNPWQPIQHRVAAAKAVLEYIHKKLPQKLEFAGTVDRKISADQLSRLTDEELSLFTKLLEKIEG